MQDVLPERPPNSPSQRQKRIGLTVWVFVLIPLHQVIVVFDHSLQRLLSFLIVRRHRLDHRLLHFIIICLHCVQQRVDVAERDGTKETGIPPVHEIVLHLASVIIFNFDGIGFFNVSC